MAALPILAALGLAATLCTEAQAQKAVEPRPMLAPTPPDYGQRPSFSFLKITVTDMDRAMRFYSDVLGMTEVQRYTRTAPLRVVMRYGYEQDARLVLVKSPTARKLELGDAYSYLGMISTDVRALLTRARQLGYQVKAGPNVNPETGSMIGILEDPDGHPIEIIQPARR